MNVNKPIPIYLFAKAPVPGKVKTRMQPELTSEQCAQLAEMMLKQTIDTLSNYWPGEVVLAITPDAAHGIFQEIISKHAFRYILQSGSTLGERMDNALKDGINKTGGAVVLGADVPHIDGETLVHGYEQLCKGKHILGPAQDGGFYLLGLSTRSTTLATSLFKNISWGVSTVLNNLIDNAKNETVEFYALDTLSDIDNYQDLKWLANINPRYSVFL